MKLEDKVLMKLTKNYFLKQLLKNWSAVKPLLTTTSEQQPPVYKGQASVNIDSPNINVQPLNNNHFWTMATIFESQGWPLYTELTVFKIMLKFMSTEYLILNGGITKCMWNLN